MVFISNPKIQQLLKEQKMFDQVEIDNMLSAFYFGILDLVIDEIQIYIEQKKLKNVEDYIRSIANEIRKKTTSTIDDQVKLYTEIMNVVKDYPELAKIINKEIVKLEDEINTIVIDTLNDEGKLKLIDIFESDLKEIDENEAAAKRLMALPDNR